jgi:CXXC-20-CXXC protein
MISAGFIFSGTKIAIGGVDLQKCESCNTQFSWSKIYKSFLGWTYKSIRCDKCSIEHFITLPGRFTFAFLSILPMLLFFNFLSPFNNMTTNIGVGILLSFIGSLISPFLVRFKMKG